MTDVIFIGLGLVLALIVFAILKIPGLWDKILAANVAVTIAVAAIVIFALESGQNSYLDVAIAFALIGFVGTQFFARFLSGRGRM